MSLSELASVSVIIPCYRCAKTIGRAVESVAAQTLRPFEIILVDDASADDTRTVLHQLKARYTPGWVKLVLLDENVGAGSARNAGWGVSSQPLIAFLDADDAWHCKKIEIQYAYMCAQPTVDLCAHGFRLLKAGTIPEWSVESGSAGSLGKWRLLLSNQFVTPSVMLRRDVPHRFLDNQRYMEDHMLWLKLSFGGARVVKLSTELAAIYKDPYGVTGLSSRLWLMERGDLDNYRRLYQDRTINQLQFVGLILYSLLKYLRRLVIYASYLRWRK